MAIDPVRVVEVINTTSVLSEVKTKTYVVEVFRKAPEVIDVNKGASLVEVTKPGGTVHNIGAGPQFPAFPYEGQIWIKT